MNRFSFDDVYMPGAPEPPDLDGWLDTATEGLCETSRKRIWEEMQEHYNGALREACGRGVHREHADAEALQSLGNPRRAKFAFRREHLTQREFDLVERVSNKEPSRRQRYAAFIVGLGTIVFLVAVPIVITLFEGNFTFERWSTIGTVIVLIAMLAGAALAGWRAYQRANTFVRLLVRGYGFGSVGISYAVMNWVDYFYIGPPDKTLFSALMLSGASIYFVGLGVFALHVRRKISTIDHNKPPSAMA